MAMYVTFTQDDGQEWTQMYYVGDYKGNQHWMELLKQFAKCSCEIQADGHELEWIFNHFDGIIKPRGVRVCNWVDDQARNILVNLKW